MKKIASFILALILLLISQDKILAQSFESCSDRYVTLVNPVRGRDVWPSSNLNSVIEQRDSVSKYGFPITWLLQYDVLKDNDLLAEVSLNDGDEKGVFLEVSESLAYDSGVEFPKNVKWSSPQKVFLSSYSQSERRLLIDTIYDKFKKQFGYYPKSVGAWWIDSYSLNYIKNKYGLSAVLIVADQRSTDSYGVWGQWWGVSYYPSSENVLVPSTVKRGLDAVVIQWAQRDPLLAYGDGSSFSNYSLQANDYIRNGKDTEYFKYLVGEYLDCRNKVGQITIGMETGMEGAAFQEEYERQLEYISTLPVKAVTMSDFYESFKNVNPKNPENAFVGDWQMNTDSRSNDILSDKVGYKEGIAFKDYFLADKSDFLDRNLLNLTNSKDKSSFPWGFVVLGLLSAALLIKRKYSVLLWGIIFGINSFGLIFRSHFKYGWGVLFVPFLNNFSFIQIVLAICIVLLSLILFKNRKKIPELFIWMIPLSYSIDRILSLLAYSKINGRIQLGIFIDRIQFLGVSIGSGIHFISERYPIDLATAFFRIPVEKISESFALYVLINPLIHVLLGALLYLILKRIPKKIRFVVMATMFIFLVLYVFQIFGADPVGVFPVK